MKVETSTYRWLRWLALLTAILVALGILAVKRAYTKLDEHDIIGSYVLKTWLPPSDRDDPRQVELMNDGSLRVLLNSGRVAEGQWTLDAGEKWVRCTTPELDYRIHAFQGWTGIQLRWVLAIDLEEYSEEVALKRTQQ